MTTYNCLPKNWTLVNLGKMTERLLESDGNFRNAEAIFVQNMD